MTRLINFLIILLLTSCTAQWHLRKAINKEPGIIDVEADTSVQVNVSYKDTSIYFETEANFDFDSDTGRTDTLFQKDTIIPDIDTIQIQSRDSIAHARTWIQDERLWLETWATVDTSKIVQDTVEVQQKIIDSLRVITTKKEATIREKESWLKSIQRWAIIAGIVIFVLISALVVRKFS